MGETMLGMQSISSVDSEHVHTGHALQQPKCANNNKALPATLAELKSGPTMWMIWKNDSDFKVIGPCWHKWNSKDDAIHIPLEVSANSFKKAFSYVDPDFIGHYVLLKFGFETKTVRAVAIFLKNEAQQDYYTLLNAHGFCFQIVGPRRNWCQLSRSCFLCHLRNAAQCTWIMFGNEKKYCM